MFREQARDMAVRADAEQHDIETRDLDLILGQSVRAQEIGVVLRGFLRAR